jgi:succinate dehydrogenase / fumarate reductase cytochrome b subunit
MNWIRTFLRSSIGRKALMALSGLALIGFLVAHLAGNLTLYADADGTAFNHYAETLESNPLLLPAEIGLVLLILLHLVLGIRVSLDNREARKKGYAVRASLGGRTLGSATMLLTGILILVFLVVHVSDFRIPKLLGDESVEDLAGAVKRRLASPLGAGVYLVGVAAVGLHLSHAFQSAFQTLGLNHPKYTPWIARLGLALAVILFLGFASFPIVLLIRGGAQ